MSEDTEQIRRETEAKWSGALAAIVKYLPTLISTIALSGVLFNGCKESKDATISKQQSGLLWHEAHQIEKQTK